mmetsp:Transcript_6533/g.15692  ORF Transcript_6533/g.15692 Transcript_6533/m.15692 type:complete len:253 (+) Transcript_6533:23-781(+)
MLPRRGCGPSNPLGGSPRGRCCSARHADLGARGGLRVGVLKGAARLVLEHVERDDAAVGHDGLGVGAELLEELHGPRLCDGAERLRCLVPDHGVLRGVPEGIDESRGRSAIQHLSEDVGNLVLEEGRARGEGLREGLAGVRAALVPERKHRTVAVKHPLILVKQCSTEFRHRRARRSCRRWIHGGVWRVQPSSSSLRVASCLHLLHTLHCKLTSLRNFTAGVVAVFLQRSAADICTYRPECFTSFMSDHGVL